MNDERHVPVRRTAGAERAIALAAALIVAIAAAGCDDEETPYQPVPVDVAGIWQQVAGAHLLHPRDDITATGDALYLRLDDGTGRLQIRDWTNGIVDCIPVLYALAPPRALILEAAEWSDIYRVDRSAGDTLKLADPEGRESVFALCATLPDSVRCGEIEVVRRFDLPDSVSATGGLAFDGTLLWFTSSGCEQLYGVDPESGAIAAVRPVLASPATLVTGAEGPDLWRLYGCGVVGDNPMRSKVWRIAPDESIRDEVDTADLAPWNAVGSAAHDPATGHLWTFRATFPGQVEFVVIDTAAEPDRLVLTRDARLIVSEMCWQGERLLALTRGEESLLLTEIDTETFMVSRTYASLAGLWLGGVAAVGDRIFLLAAPERERRAVLLEVKLVWPGP